MAVDMLTFYDARQGKWVMLLIPKRLTIVIYESHETPSSAELAYERISKEALSYAFYMLQTLKG